ncbi:MAG: hypothetical protein NT080_07435 [Spirochaetes bacterium]|nr:hypothetical protein [Spirochaetota bacterium]
MDDPIHRSVNDHRSERESGRVIYPVVSRRSGGLSVGVNLFPDRKVCNFDCPYCEVFPFETPLTFTQADLVRGLERFFTKEYPSMFAGTPVRDICISGNGEPTLSPSFADALGAIVAARDAHTPEAEVVLITNSTRLGDAPIADAIGPRADRDRVRVWAKLDAGSEAAYRRMNRSAVPFARLVDGLRSFARAHDIVIQSMFCAADGKAPEAADVEAYASLAASLLADGARVKEFHLYTQARPSPGGRTSPIGDEVLRDVARVLRSAISPSQKAVPIRVFDESGEIPAGYPGGDPA